MRQCSLRLSERAQSPPWSVCLLEHKEAGKTVSRKLPEEEAQVLEKWIANRREAKEILDAMMAISQKAYRLALRTEAKKRDPKVRR